MFYMCLLAHMVKSRTDHMVIDFRLHADPRGHGWMTIFTSLDTQCGKYKFDSISLVCIGVQLQCHDSHKVNEIKCVIWGKQFDLKVIMGTQN